MLETNKWTEEADVVVVGYGGAGSVTAIAAHDAGASVLILEKQPKDTSAQTRHTPNTRMSGGAWFSSTDREKARLYLEGMVKIANETLDAERKEILTVFSQYLVNNNQWLRRVGIETGDVEQMKPIIRGAMIDNPRFAPDGGMYVADFESNPGETGIFIVTVNGVE